MKIHSIIGSIAVMALYSASFSAAAQTRYFSFVTPDVGRTSLSRHPAEVGQVLNEFVIAVDDPATVRHILGILDGSYIGRAVHIKGRVVKDRADYNKNWSYHLDPASITLFDSEAEECDATASMVELNLDQVGGSFLPAGVWCPWSSKLMRELPIAPDQA
ncbi:hypothetical protein DWU98_02800 [Dyella monticola]|uniref:BP74 N-terminal domain-containing protein n=1 Tax=Dyella monticola TaxID=1927958 RepID=A0A370X9F3_9GAMM|nr:hypothetical protein [Dyella monticola]RDS84901.1 hypothetical protein DWU98_02800 [Dyella monticola]